MNYFTAFADGAPTDPLATDRADDVLERLAWWATALRNARALSPYRK